MTEYFYNLHVACCKKKCDSIQIINTRSFLLFTFILQFFFEGNYRFAVSHRMCSKRDVRPHAAEGKLHAVKSVKGGGVWGFDGVSECKNAWTAEAAHLLEHEAAHKVSNNKLFHLLEMHQPSRNFDRTSYVQDLQRNSHLWPHSLSCFSEIGLLYKLNRNITHTKR